MSATEELDRAAAECWLATGPMIERAEEIRGAYPGPEQIGLAYLAARAETKYGTIEGLALSDFWVLRIGDDKAFWKIRPGTRGQWLVDSARIVAYGEGRDEWTDGLRHKFDYFGMAYQFCKTEFEDTRRLRASDEEDEFPEIKFPSPSEAGRKLAGLAVPIVPNGEWEGVEVPTLAGPGGERPQRTPEEIEERGAIQFPKFLRWYRAWFGAGE